MITEPIHESMAETIELQSESLDRTVRIDFYQMQTVPQNGDFHLLLVNDGQDLARMKFNELFRQCQEEFLLKPLLIAAIHCGEDRRNEYGMSMAPDHRGWGARAALYEQFIIAELLPFINSRFHHYQFASTAFAGFSLGGLSALDIAWNNPGVFSRVGVFSGSLWWRSLDKEHKDYRQDHHRMMHQQVRNSTLIPRLKFFFQCGEQDEAEDRNRNGVIDSIDDTIDLMRELARKGFREGIDMHYLQMPDGRHDVASWKKVLPGFLKWGWSGR